ncbi:MAG: cyclic nucleotide-binding domain-containing protein [Chloroflexi bacterium]|nr:cyclic nucleotide-binding domain-containing protein [Chloroflexota bacterium]MDA1270009.1 cyclic nucleotide-binding domain-containing protein [Chloroflexota bacterium]PKB59168.1 MAG: hypothetical protein BZY83_03125 [SAR202 cluster bacterium Casp-Chloro-G2]
MLVDSPANKGVALAGPSAEPAGSLGEKINFLGKTELFKELPQEVLRQLAEETRMVYHPKGFRIRNTERADGEDTTLIDGLYVIKFGAAKVTKASEFGDAEAVVAILGNGNWFGEIGLIDGLPPSANVTAMSPMESFFLPRESFWNALNENPKIAVAMLPALGNMVRMADQWISQLL